MLDFIFDIRFFIIISLIYLLYKYGTIKYKLHIKLGHNGPPPFPYLGNFIDVLRHGLHNFDESCLKKYGKIYPFYMGNVPLAIVADEELLKHILIKDAKCFIDRMDLGFNGKHTEKFLTVLKGKHWERVRNLVSPTFTSGKLKKMSPLITDCIKLLDKRINEHPSNEPIDFKEYFGALTMDVIARTMFGMQIDSQTNPDNLFIVNGKKLFKISFLNPLIMVFVLFPKLGKLIRRLIPNLELLGQSTVEFFICNLKKAIDERQKSSEKFNDFLSEMLKSRIEINETDSDQSENIGSKSLTHEEVMAQSVLFLLAGYETTATTLTFVAYFLAKNQDAQQDVYDEIMDVIGINGDITYDLLMKLPLLDAAINETLRICPPTVRIDRVCTEDIALTTSDNSKIHAKKGDIFSVPVYAIHMDPEIWPNPNTFDLHRFDPENKKTHSSYSFMPFGMGPRNCIGMRFAFLEAKMVLVNIITQFQIVTCAETMEKITFRTGGLSTPSKPIILKVVKRNKN